MPVAIRMANGATYYPEGFEHFSNPFKKQKTPQTLRPTNPTGGGKESEYMRRYTTYGKYWADKGEDPVPNPDSGSPIKWVSKDTAAKMQRSIDEGTFDYAKSGKVGDFVKNAPHKLKYEGAKIKAGYGRGTYDYDQAHKNADGTQGGNRFGRTAAGVAGAVKSSTAYKAGAAAVGKAAEMLGNAKEWAGKKFDSAKKWAGGKFDDAKKWAGGKFDNAKEWAGTKFTNIKDTVNGAAGTAWEGIKGASGRVAKDFKNVAKAIGDTAVGQAALKAGKAALDAGGSVVGAVGGALQGIAKFFSGVYNTAKNNITGQTYKNEDKALKKAGAGR